MNQAYRDNYKLIDWSVPIVTERPPRHRGVRSDAVSAPHFIRDCMPELVGQHDGKIYTSKSAMRRSYRDAGVEEIGNEKQEVFDASDRRIPFTKDEVGEALQQVKAGYKPAELPTSILPEDDE